MSDLANMVFIVDDDPAIRKSMPRALRARGYAATAFESAAAFLDGHDPDQPGCLVLDLSMPEMTGLELQNRLIELGSELPVIFITGHGGVPESVQALKAGAVDFLEKPFRPEVLVERIEEAFAENRRRLALKETSDDAKARVARLTDREHDILLLLVSTPTNLSSKEIARTLDISNRTVDHHRARIMEKMQARSVTELVQLARTASLPTFGAV